MLIKVCGTANEQNMWEVSHLAPDMMGFIFYHPSPRNAFSLSPDDVRLLEGGIQKVGVFVDESEGFLTKIAKKYSLDQIQLHGNESPQYCRMLRDRGLKVIKALGITTPQDIESVSAYEGCCELFLFDTKTPLKGGSGQKFDHGILEKYKGNTPFLLSGGIGPDDTDILENLHHMCIGIDVNSRFETSPGIKDIPALGKYIAQIRKKQLL